MNEYIYKSVMFLGINTVHWNHTKIFSGQNIKFFGTYKIEHVMLNDTLVGIKVFNKRHDSVGCVKLTTASYDMIGNLTTNF